MRRLRLLLETQDVSSMADRTFPKANLPRSEAAPAPVPVALVPVEDAVEQVRHFGVVRVAELRSPPSRLSFDSVLQASAEASS